MTWDLRGVYTFCKPFAGLFGRQTFKLTFWVLLIVMEESARSSFRVMSTSLVAGLGEISTTVQ